MKQKEPLKFNINIEQHYPYVNSEAVVQTFKEGKTPAYAKAQPNFNNFLEPELVNPIGRALEHARPNVKNI